MDDLTGYKSIGDHKKDNSDRKKIQKILGLYVTYGVNINTMEGREGLAAIHLAAKHENGKMFAWLMVNRANLNLLSKEGFTSLMYAAKFSYIYLLADMIRSGVDMDFQNDRKATALHIAAFFGQTRASKFLLKLGASKNIIDEDGFFPADIANQHYHMATAQAIAAFAEITQDVTFQLKYVVEMQNKLNKKSEMASNKVVSALGAASKQVFNFISDGVSSAYKQFAMKTKKMIAYMSGVSKEQLDLMEACLDDAVDLDDDAEDAYQAQTVKTKAEMIAEKEALEEEEEL